jgi:hypothetical protein
MNFSDLETQSRVFNETKDCGVKAIAVAMDVPYADAHRALKKAGRVDRDGTYHHMYQLAAKEFGKKFVAVGKKFNAKTVRSLETQLRPNKRYLILVSGHALAAANGKIIDWTQGRLHRIKCILEVQER